MSGLDLTSVRDWAMFVALGSSGQGRNSEAAWRSYLNKTGGTRLEDFCKI